MGGSLEDGPGAPFHGLLGELEAADPLGDGPHQELEARRGRQAKGLGGAGLAHGVVGEEELEATARAGAVAGERQGGLGAAGFAVGEQAGAGVGAAVGEAQEGSEAGAVGGGEQPFVAAVAERIEGGAPFRGGQGGLPADLLGDVAAVELEEGQVISVAAAAGRGGGGRRGRSGAAVERFLRDRDEAVAPRRLEGGAAEGEAQEEAVALAAPAVATARSSRSSR